MLLGHLIGGSLIAVGGVQYFLDTPNRQFKKKLDRIFQVYDLEGLEILRIEKREYGFFAKILLPHGLTVEDFRKELDGIEQSTVAKIRFKHIRGRMVSLDFGMKDLNELVKYQDVSKQGMKIPLMTHFGVTYLDFRSSASCHLLGGGATRMGKTILLLLVSVHLLLTTKGHIDIILSTPKPTDFHMFRNIPQFKLCETPEQTLKELSWVIDRMKERKQLLQQKGDVADIKALRKKYPNEYIRPLFVIIDEYGVFADREDEKCRQVQEYVTEIAERAGYLDIHLIVFAQRPDTNQVLNPRIRANLLASIAFTTKDEANAKIIQDIPNAAHLGGIAGRAVLIDGMPEIVQVPFISDEEAEELLNPFRVEPSNKEDHHDREGSRHSQQFI